MALQGDLNTFALPDVLRLLAGTQKSGRLDVVGSSSSGGVVLLDGAIVAGGLSTVTETISPPEVLFELLRFDDGTFNFAEGPVDETGDSTSVDDALSQAEALVAEWAEVEAVVPSMEAWITLASELEGDTVEISSSQWKALVAIGGGGSVADIASTLELTDLPACQEVKALADASLVVVRPSHAYTPPTTEYADVVEPVELDSFEEFEVEADSDDGLTDFQDLVAEDQPVQMEDNADSLLPEPLPGAGSVYESESFEGSVDGPSFDGPGSHEATNADPYGSPSESYAPEDLVMSDPVEAPDAVDQPEPGSFADLYSQHDPDSAAREEFLASEADGPGSNTFLGMPIDPDGHSSDPEGSGDAPARGDDEERGSLLRFLSSVKN